MALTIDIPKTADLPMIEGKLRNLEREIGTAAHPQTGRLGAFEARLLSDWSDHLFKEQWAGMAIAEGLSRADEALVKEKGLTQWLPLNDEAALLNIPSLLSLQRNARVTLANGSAPYDADEVRRYAARHGHVDLAAAGGSAMGSSPHQCGPDQAHGARCRPSSRSR